MTPFRTLVSVAAGGILLAAMLIGADTTRGGEGSVPKRPNLLFVFPDQWRGQALGFLGEEPVVTPTLDELARQSLVITHACSNAPQCVPFRCMLMSGMYPHANGILCNCYGDKTPRRMSDSIEWWTDILASSGYDVGYVGKWHIPPPRTSYDGQALTGLATQWVPPDQRHGLAYWYQLTSNDHRSAPYWDQDAGPGEWKKTEQWTPIFEADRIIEFLRNEGGTRRNPDRPFALIWSANPPHMPYHTAPAEHAKHYEGLDVEQHCRRYPNIPPKGTKWGDYYRRNIKGYYAQMTGVDAQVGRVLQCLQQQGLQDNTVVMFTSDHGDCLGRHDMISKNNHYQESFSIPLIVRWPGVIPPRHDNLLFSVPDFYPTILGLLGLRDKIPAAVEGTDFAELFVSGKGRRPTSQLYCKQGFNGDRPSLGQRGVRTHTHTLMIDQQHAEDPIAVTLHDNIADPYQLKNIAERQPELVRQLIDRELRGWLERTKDPWLTKSQPFPK